MNADSRHFKAVLGIPVSHLNADSRHFNAVLGIPVPAWGSKVAAFLADDWQLRTHFPHAVHEAPLTLAASVAVHWVGDTTQLAHAQAVLTDPSVTPL